MPDRRLQLKDLLGPLADSGFLSPASLADIQANATEVASAAHPLVWLASRQLSSPQGERLGIEHLTQWMADHFGLEYFIIDPLKLDVDEVTRELSSTYTSRYRILPVAVDAQSVTFATAEPFERAWETEVAHVLKRDVHRVIANPDDINRYQGELFGVSHSIRKAEKMPMQEPPGINNLEALVKLGRAGKLDANDRHVVTIVDWLLQYAFDQRASDIHLEPRRETGFVRFRIDGVLHTVYELPVMIATAITARIKALARMDVVEKRRPQDGRLKTRTPHDDEVELRLSTMPTAFGEKLVMRIFDPRVLLRSQSELGLTSRDADLWHSMTGATHGIVLLTGPTGSGKTTTLYSTLGDLAKPEINVCTIEDPIEMISPEFNQMQVNPAIGLDFATGVRTLMRQDPDIIMVGEIRDLETAEMAIQAALTGHLVLSTLHTNDAPSALIRLMDIGVPPYLLNATLLGVMGQRLIRTLCPHCKTPVEADPTVWHELVAPWKVSMPKVVYEAKGCDECRHSGYQGRIGIYETLRIDQGLREQVRPGCDMTALRIQAMKDGMQTLRIAGVRKVAAGVTSIEEVLRVAPVSEFQRSESPGEH